MWIESHQSLARHPKTLRLARLLHTSTPAAIGHLHLLWWWCLEYADDGDVTTFEPDELAFAAMWDGDAREFVTALVRTGFVDLVDDEMHVHDWAEYAGKMAGRRKANAERMRIARATHVQRTDDARAEHMDDTSDARAASVSSDLTIPNQTLPNPTGVIGADAPPAKVTPIEKGKRGTKAPRHFDLDAEHYDLGETLGFTTQETVDETARFLDWHRSKGSTHVDWAAAWRNWMRKAADIRRERKSNGKKSAAEYAAEFERLLAEDAEVVEVRP